MTDIIKPAEGELFAPGVVYIKNEPFMAPEVNVVFACCAVAEDPGGERTAFGFLATTDAGAWDKDHADWRPTAAVLAQADGRPEDSWFVAELDTHGCWVPRGGTWDPAAHRDER